MRILIILTSLLLISAPLYSENLNSFPSSLAGEGEKQICVSIPGGYRSILLGLPFHRVKENLQREGTFDFRGEPDVSMQNKLGNTLISCRGGSFINHGFFQFKDEKLYLITLQLNPEKLDFYTLQSDFNKKYGSPVTLSPRGMVWEDEKTRLSLEYPLTVKYMDLALFKSILDEGRQHKSFEEIARNQFLEDF